MESVKASLRNELYANASFLCERLYAEVRNEDVKLLLAECYLGMFFTKFYSINRRGQSIQSLRGLEGLHSECKSVQICLDLH